MEGTTSESSHSFIWRLYPPSIKSFSENDVVYIRPKSVKELGVVVRVAKIDVDAPSLESRNKRKRTSNERNASTETTNDDRIPIIKDNGHTQHIRPSRLVPIYESSNPTIILTPDTASYRQLAVAHVRNGDDILEIGCSTGMCTALMLRRVLLLRKNAMKDGGDAAVYGHGRIVAFDTGSDMVQQTKHALESEFKNLSSLPKSMALSSMTAVHKIDAFADPKRAFALATNENDKFPNIILIDIGGNRELEGVVRMIHWVQTAFICHPPRVIIVKSKELVQQLNDVFSTGVINNAQQWLMNYLQTNNLHNVSSKRPPSYSHPLQAPLVVSPIDDTTPICRFHNYAGNGCKRYNKEENACPLDHEYCHWCRRKGHLARNCPGT